MYHRPMASGSDHALLDVRRHSAGVALQSGPPVARARRRGFLCALAAVGGLSLGRGCVTTTASVDARSDAQSDDTEGSGSDVATDSQRDDVIDARADAPDANACECCYVYRGAGAYVTGDGRCAVVRSLPDGSTVWGDGAIELPPGGVITYDYVDPPTRGRFCTSGESYSPPYPCGITGPLAPPDVG